MENDSGLSMYTWSRVAYMSEILRNIFYDINFPIFQNMLSQLEMSMMIKLLPVSSFIWRA